MAKDLQVLACSPSNDLLQRNGFHFYLRKEDAAWLLVSRLVTCLAAARPWDADKAQPQGGIERRCNLRSAHNLWPGLVDRRGTVSWFRFAHPFREGNDDRRGSSASKGREPCRGSVPSVRCGQGSPPPPLDLGSGSNPPRASLWEMQVSCSEKLTTCPVGGSAGKANPFSR